MREDINKVLENVGKVIIGKKDVLEKLLAGLLECMEERQVTVDGETRKLTEPFFVIATQNPVETAGTFPLPEAQTDRFMMKLSMGLPDREEEIRILETYREKDPLLELDAVMTCEELIAVKRQAEKTYVHPLINGYLADIVLATRKQEKVVMGVSPGGTLALMRFRLNAEEMLNGK